MQLRSKKGWRSAAILLLCCVFSTALALAQTAALKGTVTDPSGAVINGANIVAHAAGDGAKTKSTQSSASGTYTISDLSAGSYTIEASAPGFKTIKLAAIAVSNGQTTEKNIQLKLGGASTQITVLDTSAPSGSYQVKTADMGPLGNVTELDTPYTVTTIPTNLMENQGVRKFSDVLKYIPGAQMEPRSGMDVGRPQTRGFEGTVSQNARIDGMNIAATTMYPMEQFDRIEVQNGLVGSEYGAATPSGNFNFVLKRPTEKTTAKLSLNLDSPTTTTINGDVGGMVTKYFGYRVDALHTNGTGYVDESHHRREMLSGTADIHLTRRTVLQLNGSQFAAHDFGFPPNFTYGASANTIFPKAPNVSRRGLGQSWAGMSLWTRTLSTRLLHNFNDNWSVTAGGLHQSVDRLFLTLSNSFIDNNGHFTQTLQNKSDGIFINNSTQAYLKGHFKTYGFTHDVTLGTNGNVVQTVSAGTSPTVTGTTAITAAQLDSVNNPIITYAKFSGSFGSYTKSSTSTNENFIFSDTIKFARRWMVQFIGADVWIRNYAFKNKVISTTDETDGFAPSASIMYKPADNMSTYFTYASSLYNGDQVQSTSASIVYTNPGYLPPYRSKQYEIGYKWSLGSAEVSVSAYRITRPFPFQKFVSLVGGVTTYTEAIEGTQQNDGMDFMAKGKFTKHLNVFGGFTWMNPTLQNTNVAATNGKQVTGAPRIQSNILAEYEIPWVKNLAINGNWHHTGVKAANDSNTMWAPKYDTFDLGARYDEHFTYGDLSWRLSVANVGNTNYWYGLFPSGTNGQTTTGNSAFLGTPRIISASVQYRFTK